MGKKKTHDEYVKELSTKNPNVRAVEQYVDNGTKILHYCELHNIYWEISPSNALRGTGCQQCRKDKIRSSKLKTHQDYVEELSIKNPTMQVIGNYIDAKTKISHYCEIHNVLWDISPDGALSGHGCPLCHQERKRLALTRTHEEYINELAIKNPGVEAIGRYVNMHTKILHRCKIHNEFWEISPDCVLRGQGCVKCRIERIKFALRRTHSDYVSELKYVNPNVVAIETYINSTTPILHYCKIHNEYWNISPDCALCGNGCPKCHRERQSNSLRKSQKEYEDDVFAINPNLIVLGKYTGSHVPLLHKCKVCRFEWSPQPTSILSGQGCPQCRQSKGERAIRSYLDLYNIEYIAQYRFDDCRHIKPLPFDFYLPHNNICIEYQGEQHYRPVEFFGGDEEFLIRKLRDEIKRDYCKTRNIILVEVPYYMNPVDILNQSFLI